MVSFAFERKRKVCPVGIDLNRFRKNRPSEWIEWLSDDPLPPKPQQAAPVQPQIHRPQSYSPVHRPAAVAPTPPVMPNASARPVAPPGVAQPIQPIAQVPQALRSNPTARPVQPQRLVSSSAAVAQPVSVVRQQPRLVESFAPTPRPMPQASMSAVTSAAPAAAVSIQISMPKFKMPELPYRRIGYWAGGLTMFAGLAVGGWTAYQHFSKNRQVAVKGAATVSTSPTFDTLAPQDKPQLGEGADPTNTAYDGKRNLYTFKDNLMGFPLIVSQQPLPDNIKKDPKQLKKVAESMGGAVTTVDTAFGTVYTATTEKSNAQRSVFVYKDVMVFVQSYKVFDGDTWKYYVETLRQ